MNAPAPEAEPRTLQDLLDGDVHIAMLMTMIGDQHSSRPLTCLDIRDDRLSFLVDGSAGWVEGIAAGGAVVHVSIAEQASNTYVALNGNATLTSSLPEIERLWSPAAGIYFDGKEDPNVRVLQFEVVDGEFWDGPSGRIGRTVSMLRAALSHDPEKTGTHGNVVPGSA